MFIPRMLSDFEAFCESVIQDDGESLIELKDHNALSKTHYTINKVAHAMERLLGKFPKFGELVDILPFKDDLFISGSLVMWSLLECGFAKGAHSEPEDVDIYTRNDDPALVVEFDRCMRTVYGECILLRTPYTLTWWTPSLREGERRPSCIVQLVLPPVQRNWGEVFAGYHSDLVCVGFELGSRRFLYANHRWDKFFETGVATFYEHVITTAEKDRFMAAYDKYVRRGFKCELVRVTDGHDYVLQECEISPKIDLGGILDFCKQKEDFYGDDGISDLGKKSPITVEQMRAYIAFRGMSKTRVSASLRDLYCGEVFVPLLYAVTPFRTCSNCMKVCKIYEMQGDDATSGSGFCNGCHAMETDKLSSTMWPSRVWPAISGFWSPGAGAVSGPRWSGY